jgi:hypothetical protein
VSAEPVHSNYDHNNSGRAHSQDVLEQTAPHSAQEALCARKRVQPLCLFTCCCTFVTSGALSRRVCVLLVSDEGRQFASNLN